MENNELREKIDTLINENKIRENENLIVKYIPEIKFMIGFEHNHPHHNLDNSYSMIMKRLKLQYADAMAHNPKYVDKRLEFLDKIKKQLIEKNIVR